ncbi:MAG TPA: hypothetical protein VFO52_11990 [Longimicrobiales bacterium]|nr:hypothetical protein [Longimicrobiales bacterium]
MRRVVSLLLVPLLLAPACLRAQNTVPLDLVRALLAGSTPYGSQNWVEITVAGPPRQWAIEPLQGFNLLGSAAFTRAAAVVYQVHDLAAGRTGAVAQLQASGWQAPARPQRAGRDRGFIASQNEAEEHGTMLCKGDRSLVLQPLQLGSARFLHITYTGDVGRTLCSAPPADRDGYRDMLAEVPIPALMPPTGVTIQPTGSGSGASEFSSTAIARTQWTVDKLLEAYTTQLQAAGWRVDERAMSSSMAIQRWRMKHNDADWLLVLSANAATARVHVLQLQLHNLSTSRWFR